VLKCGLQLGSVSAVDGKGGLTIVWTNAPQTNVGSYAATATVSDSNYQGSANGTFTIAANSTPPSVSITKPPEELYPPAH